MTPAEIEAKAKQLRAVKRDLATVLASGVAPTLMPLGDQMRRASEAEARAAERRMRRAMLGSCECGEVAGEAVCPWCDREDLPADLLALGAAARHEERVRRTERNVRKALAAITEQKSKIANRFEKRRARSRRWIAKTP